MLLRCEPGFRGTVCCQPRPPDVGMLRVDPGRGLEPLRSRNEGIRIFATVHGRAWVAQCCANSSCRPLEQLGRLSSGGARSPPRRCDAHGGPVAG